mmetsp:Transcript_14620/g.31495  ORF Transcript_14620/g.31495 Transcript_14620/m.31495 type:complete len:1097 (+) Transcript_14620:143-3433(+)
MADLSVGQSAAAAAATTSTGTTSSSPELDGILSKLRPFQREGFRFATEDKKSKGRVLLAFEMGLGKSVTSLAIMAQYMSEWPLLILCPASLRHIWPAEIEKFIPSLPPSAVYVVSGFDDADFYSNPNKRNRIRIVVATYSLLQNRSAAARVLDQFDFRCIIADESHNLKEKSSQRCKLAMPLLMKAERVCLLSGTPALARPVELWAQLHCLAPKVFGSYTAFTKKYCNAHRGRFGWDVKGVSNGEELHSLLKGYMIRRLKSDVLKDLPPKQRTIVPVKVSPEHADTCRALIEDMDAAQVSISELVGEEAEDANFEARKLLMRAYQASGIAKASAVSDYLIDWLAGSGKQKVLVFAHHREVLDTLENAVSKKMKGVGHIRIDGTVSPAERASRVRKFQTQGRVRVAILSVTAAGVGLTLTAASSVIFAELHWTPGVLAQAEDRCHRIGQVNAVNVIYCCCKERDISIDMKLWSMLGKKVGTLGRVIDGKKFASMDAKEQNGAALGRKGGGVSAEDEIQSFFAESSPSTVSSTPAKVVKGSIESFFFSSKSTPSDSTAKKPANQASRSNAIESAPASLRPKAVNPLETHLRFGVATAKKAPKVQESKITWHCSACTYINTRKSRTTLLRCEICSTVVCDKDVQTICPIRDPDNPSEIEASIVDDVINAPDYSRKPLETSDVIEIDDDLSNDGGDDKKPEQLPNLSSPPSSPIIVIDDTDEDEDKDMNCLSFAVSKNSGRVAIHAATTGEPLQVNFDVEQVLTETAADCLVEMQTKRLNVEQSLRNTINFDEKAVSQVIESIDKALIMKENLEYSRNAFCRQLKAFVMSFLSMREIEKKVIKDWGRPSTSSAILTNLAELMKIPPSSTTDRYSGGVKERARENVRNNVATEQDIAVLDGDSCAWCGEKLGRASMHPGVESTYCSVECAEEGRLRRGGMYASTRVRAQVFALERGVCQCCGIDANALWRRISALQPAERLNALCNANWKLPQSSVALERLLQKPKEGDFWQADHILAVAEGGGSCGLDNLRTLCTPCHKIETEKLRARLRLSGMNSDGTSVNSHAPGQMDIRNAFGSAASSASASASVGPKRKRRKRTAD